MTELFYNKETIATDLSDEELADLFTATWRVKIIPAR